jgi:hypothetical protein
MMHLWRLTWSHASGLYWMHLRACDDATARAWLYIHQRDEPTATFTLSDKAPSLTSVDHSLARHPATF